MSTYLIGVDIGTQGTKAGLFREDGLLVASAFEPSHLISNGPKHVEQSPEEMYASVLRTIRQIMDESSVSPVQVAAIGMDGQMAGILGIDSRFEAITPYDSWLDTRCEPQIEAMKLAGESRIIRITGAPITYAHGPKVLWWKENEPYIFNKIAKFVLPTTYVCGKLCGLDADRAYIDSTCLHFSGFGDVAALQWSGELLDLFGIPSDKMPDIVQPTQIIGTLTSEAASVCGLKAGIPICAGAGDQAATCLGAGIVRPGLAFDVAGTASVFSCCTDVYAPDDEFRTLLYARSIIPGLWIPLAYTNGSGLCIRWIRDTVAAGNRNISYDTLAEEAALISPGSESLIFVPHFSGRVCPNDPYVRGSFLGLGLRHTRAHMYRAVLESIGYEYSQYSRILKQNTGMHIHEVYCIGGGSKSRLFSQIKADILGLPYTALTVSDSALLGSAITAGVAVKVYGDLAKTASRMVEPVYTLQPNPQNTLTYEHFSSVYAQAIDVLHGLYKAL